MKGRWVDGPKDELFNKLRDVLGGLPFFAEDWATSRPKCTPCASATRFPGWPCCNLVSPTPGRMFICRTVSPPIAWSTPALTITTPLGWWKSGVSESERRAIQAYVGPCEDGIHWAFIRLAQESVASLAVVPLQDVLGLGSEGRLNAPRHRREFSPALSAGVVDWRSGAQARCPCRSDGPRASAHAGAARRRLRRVKTKVFFSN